MEEESELEKKLHEIRIDYPPRIEARYGFGKPPHQMLHTLFDYNREIYRAQIEHFKGFAKELSRIPFDKPEDVRHAFWNNDFIGGTNALALYCNIAIRNPANYLEIGSGNSTKFARRAVIDFGTKTKITSIDPEPRVEIDAICDEVVRQPLEDVTLEIFTSLGQGDILVLDGSHRCFQNSDVTVFFLDVLPDLPSGVLIYIDDIYLPYDYPPQWAPRYYSEQYVLAALLLGDRGRRYRVVLPHHFVKYDQDLSRIEEELWQLLGMSRRSTNGIWLEIA